MQIILLEDVRNLGKFGEEKTVAGGYFRNHLYPTGKALPASARNRVKFEAMEAELKSVLNDRLLSSQKRAAEISAIELNFIMKSSDEGKLYGSIGTSEISKAFKEKGFDVKRQEIRLPMGPIREIGDYEIDIQPHAEVTCTVKISVGSDKE